jgi:hypothetical protein
VEPKEQN